LNVAHDEDAAERFHRMHEQRYGFANPERVLEIVNVRVRVRVASEVCTPSLEETRVGDGSGALRGEKQMYFDGCWVTARVFDRDRMRVGDAIEGPALVAEYTSATVLPPGARMVVDALRNFVIEVKV
jgi:N-methylhydantoinase A